MSEGARCDGSRTPGSEGGTSTRYPTYIIMYCLWVLFFLSLQDFITGLTKLQDLDTQNF